MWTTLHKYAIPSIWICRSSQYFIICHFPFYIISLRILIASYLVCMCVCGCECVHMCSICTQSLTFPHIYTNFMYLITNVSKQAFNFTSFIFRNLHSPTQSSYFIFQQDSNSLGFVFDWIMLHTAAQYSWHDGGRECDSSSSGDSGVELWRKKVSVGRGTRWCSRYEEVRVICAAYVIISLFKWKCHFALP